MPLTPSAQEFVPPKGVPSTTVATTKATTTTKEDDEKKNSNSNGTNANEKTTNEEDLKLPFFDVTPQNDAFKTDFAPHAHQTGVTPIVQTQKKFSKAIAIKKPSVLGSKEKKKANTEKGRRKGNDESEQQHTVSSASSFIEQWWWEY